MTDGNEMMIWADDGAWFQYRDENGRTRTNFLGHCDTLEGLRTFCRHHDIPLHIFSRRSATARGNANTPAVRATPREKSSARSHGILAPV
jgi:hypothetical protein